MKILCPIMASADIDILTPEQYGTEFFCGYLPEWWIKKYNDSDAYRLFQNLSTPINNRNGAGANILRIDELQSAVSKCRKRNTRLFLVVNAKYYPEYVYEDLHRYLAEVYDAGVRDMIICDMGLIDYVSRVFPNVKIAVSCLNQITNSQAVEFYTRFSGVERIVFPRHMSSEEIQTIAQHFPKLQFEYFIFSNKCLYDDGYCRGVHEFTPICKDLYYGEYYHCGGIPVSDEQKDILLRNEHEFRLWTRNESRIDLSGYCTGSFGCMACALLTLKDVPNITSVKLSIRGHSVEERLRQVKMARAVISCVENGGDYQQIQSIVSKLYGKDTMCKTGMSCIMV